MKLNDKVIVNCKTEEKDKWKKNAELTERSLNSYIRHVLNRVNVTREEIEIPRKK